MHPSTDFLSRWLPLLALLLGSSATLAAPMTSRPPETRRIDHIDYYHGKPIADPYRWLEDDNSAETKAWVETQNKATFAYLDRIPDRPRIRERLRQLWNYERHSVPTRRGKHYFQFRNNGLQNQNVLYKLDSLESTPTLLLDPNTLSADGTIALSNVAISDDGTKLAYGLSISGSDWQEWKVRDIQSGQDLPDHIRWVKFSSASWTADGSGFFYSRYDEPKAGAQLTGVNYHQKLYFHKLGTPQSDDILIYDRPDQKQWMFGGTVTEDGRYLVVTIRIGTDPRHRIYYKDLTDKSSTVKPLLDDFDAAYDVVGHENGAFWVLTDKDAPRRRLISINLNRPSKDHWIELIPQSQETLIDVAVVGHRFIANYLKDARSEVKVFNTNGTFLTTVPLPGIGSAAGFTGKASDSETFFSFTSYTVPGAIYRYNINSGTTTLLQQPNVGFNPADYETTQVFFKSKDGTRIPMFISAKKGIRFDGNNPTLLYGYGGFNISITPTFSVPNLVWMEMGGIYAVPNLRGGGEYGEEWHTAGTKLKKQNVFNDFISAAEWLIAERYTNPKRLAIYGRSNGGLLVGAAMTQRPDLFQAALPAVGVLDMLRFHKFTIGWAWVSDYGSADNPEEFKALHAYSPLHNLKPGTRYPSTLISTADHDDRVVPAHSFKFAATLQAAHSGNNPTLIRIETKAGHGAGKPVAKLIDEAADFQGFLVHELAFRPSLPNPK